MKISQIALLMLAVAAGVVFGARPVRVLAQQASDAGWEEAAGGKMAFAVASVRLNKGPMEPSNFQMGADDAYTNTGGLLTADLSVANYINFAYKIFPTREIFQSMFGKLPPWVLMDNYEIKARSAEPSPTKDQMRLMMQSLLKERFGLEVHYETHDTPVLVMSFAKNGKMGPKLQRHEDGPDCNVPGTAQAAGTDLKETDIFPAECGSVQAVSAKNQTIVMGGRNVTLEMIAKQFEGGHLGRPIVVGTGLTGSYDFRLNWTPEPGTFGMGRGAAPQEEPSVSPSSGPTFLEALRDQLGLELKEGKMAQRVLLIDHVERPSEN
jgi:bla regulator protein blaR1